MPNWKKIALSGSSPEFSSLTVDGAIEASKFSGSFSGSYQGDGSELTGLSLPQVATVSDTFTSATSKTVTHNFSTKNVIVQVYDNDDNIIIPQQVTTTDTNTVDITLDTATTGRVVVAKGGHIVSGSVDFDNLSNKPTLISSSAQIGTEISGSFIAASASFSTRVTANESFSSSLSTTANTYSGSFSGSFVGDGSNLSGVTSYTDSDNTDHLNTLGVVSSSAQITVFGFISQSSDGAISSSAQIGALGANIVSSSQGVVNLGANIVSSSAQTILNVAAGGAGIVSASAGIANLGAGIVSASGNVAALAAGIVSSSNQFQTLSLTNTTTDDTVLLTTTEDSSTAGPVLTLKRNSSSPADADYLGQIKFKGENDAYQEVVYAKVTGKILDASDGSEDGIIEIAHKKAGSNTITGRWRSDSLQLLNGTNLTVDGQVSASSFIGDGSGLTGVGTPGAISSSAQIAGLGANILSGSQTLFSQSFSSATAVTASHGFNTKEVVVSVYDDNDNLFFPTNIKTATVSAVHLDFNTARSGRVVISKGGHVVDVLANATTASYVEAQNIDGTVANATTASFASTGPFLSNTGGTVDGDVVITGNITANEYILSSSVTVVTSSFSSGSTIFGDSIDDTHLFTGSLNVTGSANLVASQSLNTRDNSSLSFWAGSQAQYDALGSYNSNTIYYVT